jgi:hypothetical protein
MFKRLRLSKNDINSDIRTTQYMLDQIGKGYTIKDLETRAIQDLLDTIDQYQLDKQGTWFGVEPLKEAIYIIAFLLGAKDFIKNNKCKYNMISDNSGGTYYQLLKNMVIGYNRLSGDNSINPDPSPEIDTDLVRASCLSPSPPSPSPTCPPCPQSEQSSRNQTSSYKAPSNYNSFIRVIIASLLFIILSNQKVYEFTNELIPTLLPSSCPSELGNIFHAFVFFLLFYVVTKLIK